MFSGFSSNTINIDTDANDANDANAIPGPAGKLPNISIQEKQRLFKSFGLKYKIIEPVQQPADPPQRQEDSDFKSLAWIKAKSITGSHKLEEIGSLKLKSVPKILLVIHSLQIINDQANVILKDETGMMQGTLHPEILSRGKLHVGWVIELENVGIFRPFKSVCHLNITLACIKSIFGENGEERVFKTNENSPPVIIDPELLSEFTI